MSTVTVPERLLQTFYLLASVVVLLVYFIPALNQRFLAYGARDAADPASGKERPSASTTRNARVTAICGFLDRVADVKVPHSWFTHFYAVSVASSAFWAYQILTQGYFYTFLASYYPAAGPEGCIRVVGCWFLLAVQGMRRLYESLTLPRSSSKMWVGHYAIGIAFYLVTGVAIWVEGIPGLKGFHEVGKKDSYQPTQPTGSPPLFLDVVANGAFLGGLMDQHILHKHLASLKKYTLPTKSDFGWIIAPHYTCECLIYLSLAFVSRTSGFWPNQTMAMALAFVIINLGISADGTKTWMQSKFGDASVARKWRMLPGFW